MKKIFLSILLALLVPSLVHAGGVYRVTRDLIEPLEGDIKGYFVAPHWENIDISPVTLVFDHGFGSLAIDSGEEKTKEFINNTAGQLTIVYHLENNASIKSDITLFAPLKVTNTTDTSISLSWGQADGIQEYPITGYKVFRDSKDISTTTGVTFTDSNLKPNTTYSYSVQAMNKSGVMYVTNTTSGRTTDSITAAPTSPDPGAAATTPIAPANTDTKSSTKKPTAKKTAPQTTETPATIQPSPADQVNPDATPQTASEPKLTLAARARNLTPYFLVGIIFGAFLVLSYELGYLQRFLNKVQSLRKK